MRLVLPDHENLRKLNFKLLELKKFCPDFFYPNREIASFYGVLLNSPADGGRTIRTYSCPIIAEAIINDYNEFGANYSHVLSNGEISENLYSSEDINTILDIAQQHNNNIIVNDLGFNNYIKTNYPTIKRIASIIRLDKLEDSLQYLRDNVFDFIVLNPSYNYFMDKIPLELRNRVVILANDCCPNDCELKSYCYSKTFSQNQNFILHKKNDNNYELIHDNGKETHCINKRKLEVVESAIDVYERNVISFQKLNGVIPVDDFYIFDDLNIQFVKIEGRNRRPDDLAFFYASIFAKPEYRERVIYDLIIK